MTYLEAVALLHDIESKYDVMSIKYQGVSVWSTLRLRLLDCISVKKEIQVSSGLVKTILKSLFYGNLFKSFGKHDIWILSGVERRKQVADKYIHRISGGFVYAGYNSLMIEKPSGGYGHRKLTSIEEKEIISESFLILMNQIFMRLPIVNKKRIENEDLLKNILDDYKIDFDYLKYIRHLVALRKSMNVMLSISHKPKVVFFECPYDFMGYQWAFHQHDIKVIELQHGVINGNHDAYNAKSYESLLNPDGICVFGEEEYKYFKNVALNYAKDIHMTGLYMLEKADQFFSSDIFASDRTKYQRIVVVSGQVGYEDQLGSFINNVAPEHQDMLFVYIPRHNDIKFHFTCDNIRFVTDVNIYEYLKWCDLHVTISSTTCLEAHYFQKPTLFYDYQKMASTYYSKVLSPPNAVAYVVNEEGFDKAFNQLMAESFEYKEIFSHNHIEKLRSVIKNYGH